MTIALWLTHESFSLIYGSSLFRLDSVWQATALKLLPNMAAGLSEWKCCDNLAAKRSASSALFSFLSRTVFERHYMCVVRIILLAISVLESKVPSQGAMRSSSSIMPNISFRGTSEREKRILYILTVSNISRWETSTVLFLKLSAILVRYVVFHFSFSVWWKITPLSGSRWNFDDYKRTSILTPRHGHKMCTARSLYGIWLRHKSYCISHHPCMVLRMNNYLWNYC